MRQTAVAAVILSLAMPGIVRAQEVIALSEREMPNITEVTGFHSLEDKRQKLFLRLMEADGSADVAKNPVALFLVVTNDVGGPDVDVKAWRLPAVAAVKKAFIEAGALRISVTVDGNVEEKTGRLPERAETLTVHYAMEHGHLSDKIQVERSKP